MYKCVVQGFAGFVMFNDHLSINNSRHHNEIGALVDGIVGCYNTIHLILLVFDIIQTGTFAGGVISIRCIGANFSPQYFMKGCGYLIHLTITSISILTTMILT